MTRSRSDGVRRRTELLDAALSCFTERGLQGTGIEDIRRAAGASPSSVYHHFAGLSDLTVALLIRTFERVCAQLAADVTATRSARDAVRALVESHLTWVSEHRDDAAFMYQAVALEFGTDHAVAIAEAKRELRAPIMDHLATFAERGQLPRWTPEQFEAVILGPSHEVCRRFLASGQVEFGWALSVLPDVAWRSLKSGQ